MNDATPLNSPAVGSLFDTTDERLAAELKKGSGGTPARYPAGELLGRHWVPVFSYARLCTNGVQYAGMLATAAFTRLFGESVRQVGPRAAWRPELLVAVRRIAGEWDADKRRGMLSPELQTAPGDSDPAAVRLLPPNGRRLVSLAFQRLPEAARCVLWHAEVEAEELAVPARLLGLPVRDASQALERARELLRQYCLEAHRELAPDDECRRYSRLLDVSLRRGGNSVDPDLRQHMTTCEHCPYSAEQLDQSGDRLSVLLVEGVLGWAALDYLDSRPGRRPGGEETTAGPVVSTAPGSGPDSDTGRHPGADFYSTGGSYPEAGLYPGVGSGSGSGLGSGSGSGLGPGPGPGPGPGLGSGSGSGLGPGPGSGLASGLGSGPGTGVGPGPGPNPGPGPGPETGPATGPGTTPGPGPDPGFAGALDVDPDSVWGASPRRKTDPRRVADPRRVVGSRPGSAAGVGPRPSAGAAPGTAGAGTPVGIGSYLGGGSFLGAGRARHPGPRHALRLLPHAGAGDPGDTDRRFPRRRRDLALAVLVVGACVLVPLVLWAGGGDEPTRSSGVGTAAEEPNEVPTRIGAGDTGPGALAGRLRNQGSGDCAGIADGKVGVGAEVVLATCTASERQQWSYESDGLLRSLADNDLCLDSGTPSSVRLGACDGDKNRAGARYDFTLEGNVVPLGQPALALAPVSGDDGAGLVLKSRNDGPAQRWEIDTSVDSLQMEWITSYTDGETAKPAPTSTVEPKPSRTAPPPPGPKPTPSGATPTPQPTASASGWTCYGYYCWYDDGSGGGYGGGGGHGGGGWGGGGYGGGGYGGGH
ncbi:ricin-type beta-trefoil lectin domain protein [Streptomyces sp. NPDC087844]|uniref:ricin-type beta-trefoil lectin domain protein n=1 Tax=Streptomyces sp. NPDC087844 TaxID=3365805 RepID=UPI0037F827B4